MSEARARRSPLLVLGLDTGDADEIERWAAEGHLPTIAGLMQRGAWGRTGGPELICEYGISLGLFSGVSRAQHGYYYFRQLAPGTYDLGPVQPPNELARPFWDELRAAGGRALVIDAPDVDPIPGLDGLQLSNWATHHGSRYAATAEPPELLRDARRIFGRRIRIESTHHQGPEEAADTRARLLDRVRRKGVLCRSLLERGPFDLVVCFFSETDAACHALWEYRAEAVARNGGRPDEALEHGIRDVYAAIDRELGTVVEQVPDATVVVVSLYGCQDEYPTSTLIESFLEQLGYHVPRATSSEADDGGAGRDRLALARRLVPLSLREAIGRRLPHAAQDRLLSERLRATTDWSRTTAFAVPSLFTSFVRVNLAGREPAGSVQPGAEYDALLDDIATELGRLTDADTGEPAVRRVGRTTELFGGGPPESLPDIFVEWEPGPRMLRRVAHPRATLVQAEPAYCPTSQERLTGFVAAAGPLVRRAGDIGEVDLIDLAPTFLRLLDLPAPERMRGQALEGILR